MDANELKQYIIDNDKASIILEDLGFHKLKDNGDYITMAVPNHNNSSGMSMLKESLYCHSFTTHFDFRGHIYDLVMEIKGFKFGQCMNYIHTLLGLKYSYNGKESRPRDSVLDFFKKYDRGNRNHASNKVKTYSDEEIESLYEKCPYIGWIHEGILPSVQEKFGVGFHENSNRVVIIHRMWDSGKICGIIGRTLRSKTEIELFDIPKYFPILKYKKSMNLFGLWENKEEIKKANEVIIVESEKAVMQLISKGYSNVVAVCCHDLSEEQVRILISLDVDITIAFDKDVELDFIKKECSKFKGMRNVYYIYDELGLLKDKESPADKHIKVWEALYKRKVKYKGEE